MPKPDRPSTPAPEDPRSDAELLDALGRGDDAGAFEVLYYRHRDWVVRLAYRFTRNHDDALDVLQETFRYLLSKVPGLRLEAKLRTFLYPAVRNLSLRAVERRRRLPGGDERLEVLKDLEAPAPRSPDREREELDEILVRLPEGQREVLLLRFADDLSLEEIAAALSIPIGTVKSRLHHAIRALREDVVVRRQFGSPE